MLAVACDVEESATLYVNPETGDDSNPGTKLEPFATAEAAVSAAGVRDRIAIDGDFLRLAPVTDEPEFNAALPLTEDGQGITSYGKRVAEHTNPILSCGKLATGWAEVAVAGEGTDRLTNGNFETWSSETLPGSWTPGTTTHGIVKREDSKVHSGSHALKLEVGKEEPNTVNLDQPITFEANEKKWLSLWHYAAGSHPETKVLNFEIEIKSGTFSGYSLQDDFTWAKVSNRVAIPVAVAYAQDFFTFTMPNGAGTARFRIVRGSGETTFYADDVELKEPVPGSGIFRAAFGGTRPSNLTWDPPGEEEAKPLNEIEGPVSALAEGEWFYDAISKFVYVRLPGNAEPSTGTVEGSVSNAIDVQGLGCRVSRLELRHTYDRGLRVREQAFSLTDVFWRYCASVGNGGVLSCGADEEGVIDYPSTFARFGARYCGNDGIWFGKYRNWRVDHEVGRRFDTFTSEVSEPTSDCLQLSLNQGGDVGLCHVRDIFGDKVETKSNKGTTIFHGDKDTTPPKTGKIIVQRVTGVLGNFGFSFGMSGIEGDDMIFYFQSHERNWGGAAYMGELEGHVEGQKVGNIALVGCAPHEGNGVSIEDGTELGEGLGTWVKNIHIHDLLLCDVGQHIFNLHAPMSGIVENVRGVILSGHNPTRNVDLKHGAPEGETLTLRNNIYPPDYTGAYKVGSTIYDTLAAYQAASGQDVGSKAEALNKAATEAELDAWIQRLTRRTLGTPMTHAEAMELVPS